MNSFNVFKLPGKAPAPLGAVYALMGFLLPIVGLFNARALVPVIAVCALTILILGWRGGVLGALRRVDTLLILAMAGYMTVFVASSLVAPSIGATGVSLAKLTGIVLMAWVLISMRQNLAPADVEWLSLAMLAGILLTAAWILFDVASGSMLSTHVFRLTEEGNQLSDRIRYYGYFWYKSASTVTTIMALVLGIYLRRKGHATFAFIVVGIVCLSAVSIHSRTAAVGVAIALAAGFIYSALGRHRVRITVATLALAFLLPVWLNIAGYSPEAVSARLDKAESSAHSVVYRLHIWRYTVDKIMEKPLLGWGAGASKRLGNDDVARLEDAKFGTLGEPIPNHPHNGVLQIWLEFGAFGAIMGFLLLARGICLADRLADQAGSGTRTWGFAVIALIGSFFGFNFSISSSWWLATVVALIAIAATFTGPPKERRAP